MDGGGCRMWWLGIKRADGLSVRTLGRMLTLEVVGVRMVWDFARLSC